MPSIFYRAGVFAALNKFAGANPEISILARKLMLRDTLGSGLAGGSVGALAGGLASSEGNRAEGALRGGLIGASAGAGIGAGRRYLRTKKLIKSSPLLNHPNPNLRLTPHGEKQEVSRILKNLAGEKVRVGLPALAGLPAAALGAKRE